MRHAFRTRVSAIEFAFANSGEYFQRHSEESLGRDFRISGGILKR